MNEAIVVDSACLIALERIGRLDVLTSFFDPIYIPPEVQSEFAIPIPWLTVKVPANQSLVLALKMQLDDGESEAIALAVELGIRIILDDRQARSVARRMGVKIIGTVGILVIAKTQGVIPALKPILDDLEAAGVYLAHDLKEEALRLVGE